MSISEMKAKLTELCATVAGLVSASKAANITPEQRTALEAGVTKIEANITSLQTAVTALQTAVTAAEAANATATQTIAAKDTEITNLKAELANKQKLAVHGATAAAEVAANQTVAAVPEGTDQAANGKSQVDNLRAKMAAETDPAKKMILARQLRAAKGIEFTHELVPAKK